ncbi:isoprenyl transferase [Sphingomonas sp. ID0503]|uniref:isoprenyl transferase n=1 Tax=Sphingomonas sp. ID0503 TaxID=3399691 RepID=UPI003AFA14C2
MSSAPAPAIPPAGGGAGPVPRHVAIIMDGNGRWAKRRHLPHLAGHRQGAEAVRKTIEAAAEMGIEALTLYAFSSENWRRPEDEISGLMSLLKHFLRMELGRFHKNGLRLQVIGDYRCFPADVVDMLDDAVAHTAPNSGMIVALALNYGSQRELTEVARSIALDVRDGRLRAEDIDERAIEARLDTASLPPLDLLIRTSGEVRLSNFLLWQAAYAEFLFIDTLWPDFDGETLAAALDVFARRERRFGGR